MIAQNSALRFSTLSAKSKGVKDMNGEQKAAIKKKNSSKMSNVKSKVNNNKRTMQMTITITTTTITRKTKLFGTMSIAMKSLNQINSSTLNRVCVNYNDICYYSLLALTIIATTTVTLMTAVSNHKLMVAGEGQISVDSSDYSLTQLLGRCRGDSDEFDSCMKDVFNDLRPYFPTGIPSYNILPFDPHHCQFVELRRGDESGFGGFKLILRNVSEYGWSRSEVTKYRTDHENHRIIYSQYFPEKSLEGYYEFSGKVFGTPIKRKGFWNMTLYDYSQTTSVRRLGGPGALLKVHVEIDHIGGLKMHIANFLAVGRQELDNLADGVINSMWPIGFPFIKPIINELVSTAFTDIFNESFRYFPFEHFVK